MDYRLLMLADPKEIKAILEEFGGRSDDEVHHQPGWVSKLIARIAHTLVKLRVGGRVPRTWNTP